MKTLRRFSIIATIIIGVSGILIAARAWTEARHVTEQTETITLTVDGRERLALLHVPPVLDETKPAPLVFAFHGGGGTAANTLSLTKLHELADREGFLVVFPQGIGNSWNDGRVTQVSQAHREGVDDLAFIDALLARLLETRRIDPKRVFATGISNGGMFTHHLAANRAEKFAAIAPVVGGITKPFHERFKPAAAVSVLIIQGTDDPLVPYAGGQVLPRRKEDRGSIISTDEAVRLWVNANACQQASAPTMLADADPADGCQTEVTQWKGGRDGSEVRLYQVKGGGHTWPDGPQYLPEAIIGRVTHDFDSQAIWDFFKSHPKP